jgi:hypothetical protein
LDLEEKRAMDGLTLVFFLVIVVEKIVEILKDIVYAIPIFPDKFRPPSLELLSLACGVLLAFRSGINALELLDVKITNPYRPLYRDKEPVPVSHVSPCPMSPCPTTHVPQGLVPVNKYQSY